MNEHSRRIEDTPIGKVFYFWPAILGICTAIASAGVYIGVEKTRWDGQAEQQLVIQSMKKTYEEFIQSQVSVNTKLATIIDEHARRLDSIEDWRNGVSDAYITHHKRRE